MSRVLARIAVSIASAGWLIPLWVAIESLLSYSEAEILPRLAGQAVPLNSFPYTHFARLCFAIAFSWLGVAIASWAYYLSRRRA